MKRLSVVLILLFSFSLIFYSQTDGRKSKKKSRSNACKITGRVTYTKSHCGGVRLTEEQMNEMRTPRPLAGKKLYIKKGNTNTFDNTKIVAEVTADEKGEFTLELPPGEYLIVDEKKKDTAYYNQILKEYSKPTDMYSAADSVCMKTWYQTPELIFTVKKGQKIKPEVNFPNRCSWNTIPCAHYKGPLPP